MKKEVSILLVGTGGYGNLYIDALFGEPDAAAAALAERYAPFNIAGAVEPAPAARSLAAGLGIPLYDSIDEFYAERRADLAVLSTPIHLHCEQIIACLKYGSNVLCEKPMCATVEQANEIRRAEKASGKFVKIGYQMSFSRAVLDLKADILNGKFGKPVLLKTLVHYPRDEIYYARNQWAGRRNMPDGRPVNDSPLHNAVSHHFNNMLFVLGGAPDIAAIPATVQAELYRGNPDVDNFDTAALRCKTVTSWGNEIDILFYTSHSLARENNIGPICQYRFEKATVTHLDDREHETFFAMLDDGGTIRYEPSDEGQSKKLWDCMEAVRGGAVPPGGTDAAAAEVISACAAQQSRPVVTIPDKYVKRIGAIGARYTNVAGLEDMMFRCFERNLLPSELEDGFRPSWAVPGDVVPIPADALKNPVY